MVLAKQLPAAPAVHGRIVPAQGHLGADRPRTEWIGTNIAVGWPLPMMAGDVLFRISSDVDGLLRRCRAVRVGAWGRGGRIVGFEHVEALELLVQDCQWLELLRLLHLQLEPVLDLVLLLLDQVLVVVVEMAVELQQGHHLLVADGADQPAGGICLGILGGGKQDLAADVVPRLGGARGAVGGLGAER